MKTDYVVGFAFSLGFVLLIKKARPAWQKDKLNGVGGHVEDGELPQDAMVREFFEETGIFTSVRDWKHFAVVMTDRSRVFMYTVNLTTPMMKDVPITQNLANTMTTNDETVGWYPDIVKNLPTVPNIPWLVELAKRAEDLPAPAVIHEVAAYER